MQSIQPRESLPHVDNPLGMEGIEFIEYFTTKPQALGQVLESVGFHPVARHRSREVLLYRQGDMNIIVNAHDENGSRQSAEQGGPVIGAIALRVRDAGLAYRRALDKGAWAVPTHVEVMELNIPAIHGVGSSRIYFVDRFREFSIYDVDFVPIPGVEQKPAAIAGFHFFGAVQYIGWERTEDWTEFYRELFGFTTIPDDERFGILPRGRLLRSPCHSFMVQLVEPHPGQELEGDVAESFDRIGLGTPDVAEAVRLLKQRGVLFVESPDSPPSTLGALASGQLFGLSFELVHAAAR
ncbi:MAG TPA: 4-hydroxyphenylpyruvate dioxygenase [Candidatus Aquabacterium excrementipullorum]|nr:4-hydroxyphenylpyruvate dioxygenase [Candidatus Aquabacterium excrementipullorum]